MKVTTRSVAATLLIMACWDASSYAVAQTPDDTARNSADVIPEITVTARKRDESLQDVPIAVTALNDALIEEQQLQTLDDLRGNVPNIVIEPVSGQALVGAVYIRGIGSQELEQSVDPAVGVVIDGVYLANAIGMLPYTFDFDQVEILRGPQGTLFGKNTTGGVINIRRKAPSFELSGAFEGTIGSFDRRDIKFAVGGGLSETIAARIAVARLDDAGSKFDIFKNRPSGSRNFFNVTPSILFKPNDRLSALLRYEYQRVRSNGSGNQNLSGLGNSVNQAPELACSVFRFCGPFGTGDDIDRVSHNSDEALAYDLHAVTAQVDLDVGVGTVTNIFGYRTHDIFTSSDVDNTPAFVFLSIRDQTFRQFSNELRFASKFSDRIDFVVGGHFFNDAYSNFQRTLSGLPIFGPVPPGTEALLRQNQSRTSYAAFGEANYKVADTVTLTVGGRYTTERKRFTGRSFLSIPVAGERAISQATGEKTWNDFSPKVGVAWKPSTSALVYYSFSQGFRSGGFNGRNATPDSIGPYNPERVRQHELGFKTDLFDRSLRLNLAMFSISYTDKQEDAIQADPVLASVTVTTNAARASIRGFEGELSFKPRWLSGFSANANIGFTDARYRAFCADLDGGNITNTGLTRCGSTVALSNGGTLVPTDNSALKLRRAPKWQWGINARQTFDAGVIRPTIWGALRYTSSYFTDLRNDPRSLYQSEHLVDAGVDLATKLGKTNLNISGFVRNLTNRQQVTGVAVVPGVLAFGTPTTGRTWGLEIGARF